MEHKIEWAKEQVKKFEHMAKGVGLSAIVSRQKLKQIKELTEEEFERFAISSYDHEFRCETK